MLPKPLDLAHQIILPRIQKGGHLVDATLGNGNDAAFLLKALTKVGGGTLTGVDLQAPAIDSSRQLLNDIHAPNCSIQLYQQCHAEYDYSQHTAPDIVMFNLGYLPKFDKTIITQPETSLKAVKNATKHLKQNGLISIMGYLGHDGGEEECSTIELFVQNLPRKEFRVLKYQYLNAPNTPPYLLLIEKCA